MKSKKLYRNINQDSKTLLTSDDTLKKQIEIMQKEIATSKKKTEMCNLDKISVQAEVEKIKQNNEILDLNIRDATSSVQKLNEIYAKTKKSVDSTKEYEKEIVEKLANHIKLENEMAEELLKYRGIVAEARSSYQKFEVKRI